MDAVHLLMRFGLTHQEAKLYLALHQTGSSTGYELAKLSGVSRSNAYAGLSSLADKGGAWLIDGKPARYQAVPVAEFCGNAIRGLGEARMLLEQELSRDAQEADEYITVRGERGIRDKIETMIEATERHIYLSMPSGALEPFLPGLRVLLARGLKVVVLSDKAPGLAGATVHLNPERINAIRVISDTTSALTGSLPEAPGATCLYSRKQNLVDLLRDSMANEIKLIRMSQA